MVTVVECFFEWVSASRNVVGEFECLFFALERRRSTVMLSRRRRLGDDCVASLLAVEFFIIAMMRRVVVGFVGVWGDSCSSVRWSRSVHGGSIWST